MEAILDTNFIISCMKKNIDFVEAIELAGLKLVVPKEVMEELKDLRQKSTRTERAIIELSLDLIEKRKIKKMKLPKGKVDEGLISLGKKGAYIATLDKAIRNVVPRKIGISAATNSILVETN